MLLVKCVYTGPPCWDDDGVTACVCTCVIVGYYVGEFVLQGRRMVEHCSVVLKHQITGFQRLWGGTFGPVDWLFHRFGSECNISTAVGWIGVKRCTYNHVPQRMNPADF